MHNFTWISSTTPNSKKKLMIQFQENTWPDGRKEGWKEGRTAGWTEGQTIF